MLAEIAKVQIIGIKTKNCMIDTIHEIHKLGLIQFIDTPPEAEQKYRNLRHMTLEAITVKRRQKIRQTILEVEGLLATLPSSRAKRPPRCTAECKVGFGPLLDEVRGQLDDILDQVRDANERIETLEAEQSTLPYYKTLLVTLTPLSHNIHSIENFDMVALLIDKDYKDTLDLIHYEIERITYRRFEMVDGEIGKNQLAVIFAFPHEYRGQVDDLLGQESVNEVRLPTSLADKPIETIIEDIDRRLKVLANQIADIRGELQVISDNWYSEIVAWRNRLQACLEEIDKVPQMWETDHTFVIFGWIRKTDIPILREKLGKTIGDDVVVGQSELTPEEKENAPVIMDNSAIVEPFEFFMRLLSPPRYGTIDPTPYMAFFLPAFFGVIVGDFGYGLVFLTIAAYLIRTRTDAFRTIGQILGICGAWTIVFGVLFGEFFGTLGPLIGVHPILLDRADPEAFVPLISMSVIMGLAHVILGLVLGILNGWRERHTKEVLEKVGMIIAILALIVLLGIFGGMISSALMWPFLIILGIAVVILTYCMGIMGPMEIFSTVGNILSYIRIAAIGLSSVFLAEVANELGKVTGNIILGIVVGGVFHLLNIILGAFSPTIHAMRLHFVEFFSKFVEYSSNRFAPFKQET